VEFDASKRALKILERFSELDQKEIKKANRFLRSAGYTYLGNFCSTLFIWTFLVPNPKII
jgi:Zn-dependent membrane protease YugP